MKRRSFLFFNLYHCYKEYNNDYFNLVIQGFEGFVNLVKWNKWWWWLAPVGGELNSSDDPTWVQLHLAMIVTVMLITLGVASPGDGQIWWKL